MKNRIAGIIEQGTQLGMVLGTPMPCHPMLSMQTMPSPALTYAFSFASRFFRAIF
jgi:hypothetical protein